MLDDMRFMRKLSTAEIAKKCSVLRTSKGVTPLGTLILAGLNVFWAVVGGTYVL